MVLKKSQIPNFLEEFGEELESDHFVMGQGANGIRILKEFDRFEVKPEAFDRDWYWLDVSYGFGNTSLSLAEILQAREEGQRYIATEDGWVDCQAKAFDGLGSMALDRVDTSGKIRLSRQDLLRLHATARSLHPGDRYYPSGLNC